ncbi:propanol-preferring alcohol dehydrogenase [Salinibacterium sp. CAN_S4]|uniref:NAD(P)-dependent alcohol dehydrogenase n=1 Tax=Salinibacterium sp. CAN_S4 TaxID=2787727 RepID=UPI0018F03D86
MRALQYRAIGSAPVLVEVDQPEPGPGQVLLKVSAAGVCHSDQFLMGLPQEQYDAYGFGLPLTLGHEGAGTVEAIGAGVTGVSLGESMAVYGPWGCGRCHMCAQGKENYCTAAASLGIQPPGLGAPGSMADYLLIDDARHLVPLGDLDPVANVSLTDAGLTPYHAITLSLPKLVAGTTAVVIGAGGLGHVGIQILKAMTPARVIAVDLSEQKLELARSVGADEAMLSDGDTASVIRGLTGGLGASVVIDFVGAQPTVELASTVVAVEGDLTIVGIGGGMLPVGFGSVPYDVAVRTPYWGTRAELMEVLDLARAGRITVETEVFSLADAPLAYEKLHAGTIRGRAVIVP